MYKKHKVRSDMFTDDFSQSVLLEYFVTRRQPEDEKAHAVFGIEIAKYVLKNGVKELAEREHSGFFSQNQAFAVDMATMLADNLVTPVTLYYVLDDNIDFAFLKNVV